MEIKKETVDKFLHGRSSLENQIDKFQDGGKAKAYFSQVLDVGKQMLSSPFRYQKKITDNIGEGLSAPAKALNYLAQNTARTAAKYLNNVPDEELPKAKYESHSETVKRLNPTKSYNFVESMALDAAGDPTTFVGAQKVLSKVKPKAIGNAIKSVVKKQPIKHAPAPADFKSEIDWSKWNPETPTKPDLMKEYSSIEHATKQDGSWMKNADGSPFDGVPEQFIQQNSSWFKKAYPNGINKTYRGALSYQPDYSKSKHANVKDSRLMNDRAIFTADEGLAKTYDYEYQGQKVLDAFPTEDGRGGVWHLAQKKSKKVIDYDTQGADWTEIDLNRPFSRQDLADELVKNKVRLEKLIANGAHEDVVDPLRDRLKLRSKQLDEFTDKPTKELTKLRKDLKNEPFTTTDDLAGYMHKGKNGYGIDYIKLRNLYDGSYGEVNIHNNRMGNYLKSLRGNVGYFNLKDPNVLKAAVPAAGAGAYGYKLKEDVKGN